MLKRLLTIWRETGFFRAMPGLILILGLTLTYLQVSALQQREKEVAEAAFGIRAGELVAGLERRMLTNTQILRGAAGLFASSEAVSREEFRRYVATLRLAEYYPGIQGLGYSRLVPAADKTAHVAAVRAAGIPEYRIWPEGDRATYSAVVYVEPFDWRNQRALGFDMLTEPTRTKAAAQAQDEGRVIVSERVKLVQETEQDVQAGVLIFAPLYQPQAPLETVEQRRAALRGWAYLSLRVKDLVDHYLQREYADLSGQIALHLYSGEAETPDALMYETHPSHDSPESYKVVHRSNINGAIWTIAIEPLAAYWAGERVDDHARLVLVIGLCLTLLLALASKFIVGSHARLTAALRELTVINLAMTEKEKRIQHLAHHDYLTDLPNRLLLVERAAQALDLARRHQRRMAIIFIDLDRFKPINDEYGHDAGDAVLCAVARRLQSMVRKSDTVCRQGGDEFVILLPEFSDCASLETLAKQLRAAIQAPCEFESHQLTVSASIGIAVYPDDGDTVDAIIQSADSAMYRAKVDGKSHICFAENETKV